MKRLLLILAVGVASLAVGYEAASVVRSRSMPIQYASVRADYPFAQPGELVARPIASSTVGASRVAAPRPVDSFSPETEIAAPSAAPLEQVVQIQDRFLADRPMFDAPQPPSQPPISAEFDPPPVAADTIAPQYFQDGAVEAVDLTEEMSYVIDIHREVRGATTKIQVQRVYDGRRLLLTDVAPQAKLAALKIFAQSIETQHGAEELQLECKGKVIVLANQSLIRGEDLVYSGGEFQIASTEILTPDTKISSGASTFAFPVGALSITSLSNDDELAEPDAVFSSEPREVVRY